MDKALAILMAAALASAATAAPGSADARRRSRSRPAAKSPSLNRLAQQLKAQDRMTGQYAAEKVKDPCAKRTEYSSVYRESFTDPKERVEYDVKYTDKGGPDSSGNCVVDAADTILLSAKRKNSSGFASDMEFEAALDGRILRAELVGYSGHTGDKARKEIEAICRGIESTYQIGCELKAGQLNLLAQQHKRVRRLFDVYVSKAYNLMRRQHR